MARPPALRLAMLAAHIACSVGADRTCSLDHGAQRQVRHRPARRLRASGTSWSRSDPAGRLRVTGGKSGVPPPTTTGLRNMRSSSTRRSSIAAAARPAPPIETSLSVGASRSGLLCHRRLGERGLPWTLSSVGLKTTFGTAYDASASAPPSSFSRIDGSVSTAAWSRKSLLPHRFFGDQPAPSCARRAARVRLVRPHLVDVRWIVDRPPPKRSAGALRGDPKSPGKQDLGHIGSRSASST
jgi:hypothetical protein